MDLKEQISDDNMAQIPIEIKSKIEKFIDFSGRLNNNSRIIGYNINE
jgi:hypothetical protein